jgi:hypothetical protein
VQLFSCEGNQRYSRILHNRATEPNPWDCEAGMHIAQSTNSKQQQALNLKTVSRRRLKQFEAFPGISQCMRLLIQQYNVILAPELTYVNTNCLPVAAGC